MFTLIRTFAVLCAIAAGLTPAMARDVRFMTRPNGESLPLFILKAKAAEFLPEGINVVLVPTPRTPEAVMMGLKNKDVDYAPVFHMLGAKLHTMGLTHLRLAGVHGWAGVGILSKTSIKPGDWAALKGTAGLATPGVQTPPHMMSAQAMKKNGINPRQDVMFAGTSVHNAFDQMASVDNAPDWVIIPEPQLSHGMIRMKKQQWPTQYHLFADPVRALSDKGMPLGSFWIVGDQPDAEAVIAGFDKAVDYMMNPANRHEVARIIASGFSETFGKRPPPKVFDDMLARGLLKLEFKLAGPLEAKLREMWSSKGIKPVGGIVWQSSK